MTRTDWIIFGVAIMTLAAAETIGAKFGPSPTDSTVDPSILMIDDEYLGVKVDGHYTLIDEKGRGFEFGELMGKPLVLVLSYYTCDGSCTVQNQLLKEKLLGIERVKAGVDYNVLTVSFDKNDDKESLEMFVTELDLPAGLSDGWRLALFKNEDNIKRLTGTVGFNYFWSLTDRVFLHPSVFIFISPEGRVVRHIYAPSIEKKDIELAILETGKGVSRGSKVTDLGDLFLVACFSYNFKEGKYTLNYPLFIAVGALLLGISLVVVSLTVFKSKARREGHG
jgi:protein SCO1/2